MGVERACRPGWRTLGANKTPSPAPVCPALGPGCDEQAEILKG